MSEATSSGGTGGANRPKYRKVGEGSLLTAINQYRFDPKMSKAQRIAHFLNWMVTKFPYVPIPADLVTKAINGYGKKPRMGSEEVLSVMHAATRAKEILRKQYGRSLRNIRGEGMCATVDDEDTAATTMRSAAARFSSAQRGLAAERAIVDPTKIRDEKLRRWVRTGVDGTLKMLESDDRLMKLLPPKTGDDDETEE